MCVFMCVVGTKEGLARGKLLYFVAVVRVVVVVDFVVEVASKFAESDDICVVSVWSTRATTERHIFSLSKTGCGFVSRMKVLKSVSELAEKV